MMTRIRREQGGAVAVMVALTLFALVGMLVLTVDLGGLWNARRKLSTGADAAALAAAQECAESHGSGAARAAAARIAGENAAGAQLVSLTFVPASACEPMPAGGSKLVTVKLTTSVEMYFAPIFGVNSSPVTAQATAVWASPGAAPISVNAAPLEACRAASLQGQTECTLEYPSQQFQEPRWGVLALDLWNQPITSCPRPASYANGIISSGGIWPLPKPIPAYDCLDNGDQSSTWQLLEGKTFWFPVIDEPNSILKNGKLVKDDPGCTKGPNCRVVSAYVIDFVKLKVLDVRPGNPVVLTVELVPSLSSTPGTEIRLVD